MNEIESAMAPRGGLEQCAIGCLAICLGDTVSPALDYVSGVGLMAVNVGE